MMKYLQKLGKALMLPVAVLPICGILMGLGYALAPGVMGVPGAATSGAAYTVGFLLVKAGGALIDNMAWLFAIGAAVGLADDHDGTAGLAGLVSYLMMQQLLSPGVVSMVRTLEEGTATYIAFQKVAGNSFIGILAAVVGAACYNKFKSTQMPDWLAFFSGKRFVAIATGLISIVVSVALLFVWPVIFDALVAIGRGIAGMDGIGAGIYAFLNRLLIPTGLHHALNNVFWFDTIGLGDLSHFWAGETSADVGWSLGMYMSGFFPCMMFGIAGAALAMVRTAKNKKAAIGLVLSAAICAFVCGVIMDYTRSMLPIVNPFIDLVKGKRLDKSDMKSQMKTILEIVEEVKAGRRYIIFPEGGYDHNKNTVQRFMPGSFKCATKAKAPIVPVAIIDSYKPFGINSLRKVKT